MTPKPADAATSRRLRQVRQRDTSAELAVRRLVHARGLRYRVDVSPLPGVRSRADLVFARERLAVFIDGCFWHRCPIHGTDPKNNADWWKAKLDANVKRDRDIDQRLREAGWNVVRAWEHEDPGIVADRIESAVFKIRTTA